MADAIFRSGSLIRSMFVSIPEGPLGLEDRCVYCRSGGSVRLRFGINERSHVIVRALSFVVFDIDPCSSGDEVWFDELLA